MGLISKIEDKLSGSSKHEGSSSGQNTLQKKGEQYAGDKFGASTSPSGGGMQSKMEQEALKQRMGVGGDRTSALPSGFGGSSGSSGGMQSSMQQAAPRHETGNGSGFTGGPGGNSGGQSGMLSRVEDQMSGSGQGGRGVAQDLRHPIQSHASKSAASSGMPNGGAAVAGAGVAGIGSAGTYGASHNRSNRDGNIDRDGYSSHVPSGGSRSEEGSGIGSTGSRYAQQPMDPYSSSGQRAAAQAGEASGMGGAGYGDRRDDGYGRRSVEDTDVTRNRSGGVTNQMTDAQGFSSGPHHRLENHSAIPTAGGAKLGSIEGSENAMGGRTSYEQGYDRMMDNHTGGHGLPSRNDQQPGTHGSSHAPQEISYMNRPATGTNLGSERYDRSTTDGNNTGSMGTSAHSSSMAPVGTQISNHSHHGSASQGSTGGSHGGLGDSTGSSGPGPSGMGQTSGGVPQERKLGGAYEAGYRDAMAHIEAERQKQL